MTSDNQHKPASFRHKITRFIKAHPVFSNFIAVILASILAIWLLGVVFLGVWTNHGETVTVPMVKGMKVDIASHALKENGFEVELDSIYDSTGIPGVVIDQSPGENASVKDGRTVYLRYVCYSPKMVTVPDYTESGRRGALAAFRSLGINDIKVKELPSSNSSRVAARYNGLLLKPGDQIPVNAAITLEVPAESYLEETFESELEEFVPGDVDEVGNGVYQEDLDEEFLRSLDLN